MNSKILLMLGALCLGLLGSCQARDHAIGLKTQLLESSSAYQVSFTGNRSFPAGILQKAIAQDLKEYEARGFRTTSADDAAYSLEVHYHRMGFPRATVNYRVEQGKQGRPKIRFEVTEGTRTTITKVSFQGAERFSQEELAKHLSGPSTLAFGLGKLYYVKGATESATGSIESLYYQEGYIDVRIEGPTVQFSNENRDAQLTYTIDEGLPHVVSSIQIGGDAAIAGVSMQKVLDRYIGKRYFPRITHQIRAACASQLADMGYADAQCQASESIHSETGQVEIVLRPVPGPLVTIGLVQVKGNQATRTAFIYSQLELLPGTTYSREAEQRSFRNLYATGLFNTVKIDLVGTGDERNIEVNVEEASSLSTSVELGYGSFERARLLLGVTQANLAGTGRSLSLQGKLAEKARGAKIFFTDPYTIDRNHVLGLTMFVEQRKNVSFESVEYGTGASLTHQITRNYRQVYGHEIRVSEANNVEVFVPGFNKDVFENAEISALYLTNIFDTRDSFFLPKQGSWLRLRTEYASDILASELSFLRFEGRAAHYFPLDESSQVAFGARGGVIFPMQGTEAIPLQERFFNGGQNSVRSFREDELGPVDVNGKQVGGEAFSVLSLEYRRELFGSFSAALFADAGNVSLDHGDALDFKGMRYGVGPGLRWLLPIGPLRLDWGINPDRHEGEQDWVLQFSLGVAF